MSEFLPEELRIKSAQPLTLRTDGNLVNTFRVYSHYENAAVFKMQGSEIFHVDKDGEIWQGDRNITEDEAALAECLRQWIECQIKTKVRRPVRDGDA